MASFAIQCRFTKLNEMYSCICNVSIFQTFRLYCEDCMSLEWSRFKYREPYESTRRSTWNTTKRLDPYCNVLVLVAPWNTDSGASFGRRLCLTQHSLAKGWGHKGANGTKRIEGTWCLIQFTKSHIGQRVVSNNRFWSSWIYFINIHSLIVLYIYCY